MAPVADLAAMGSLPFSGRGQAREIVGALIMFGTVAILGMAYARRRTGRPARVSAVVAGLTVASLALFVVLPGAPGGGNRSPRSVRSSSRQALDDAAFANGGSAGLADSADAPTTSPTTWPDTEAVAGASMVMGPVTTSTSVPHRASLIATHPPLPPLLPSSALNAALHRWLQTQPAVGSVAVAVGLRGQVWTGGASRGTPSIRPGDKYAIASITKSFTIGLVLQQAATGRIDLDAPMPSLPGVAPIPDGVVITPRELLQHSSGLVDYSLADGFDQSKSLTPADAVSLSLRTELLAPPGQLVHYANSNYLWLGLLLERVSGRSYHDQVAALATSLDLKQTEVDPWAIPGWVGFSSGGIHSTLADVSRYEQALLTPGRIIPAQYVNLLTTLNHFNVGLGTWPLCPCGTDAAGNGTSTAIGHYVANGGSYHYPDGMSLVVRVDPPGSNSEALIASLGAALRAALPSH